MSTERELFLYGESSPSTSNVDIESGLSGSTNNNNNEMRTKSTPFLQTFAKPDIDDDHHDQNTENESLINNRKGQPKSHQPKIINGNNNRNNQSSMTPNNNNNNGFGNIFPIRKWNGNNNNNNNNLQISIDVPSNNNNNDDDIANMVNNNSSSKDRILNNSTASTNGNNGTPTPPHPHQQMELIWRHLSYTVSRFEWKSLLKKDGNRGYTHRRLLDSISGSMRAGELMAIMGPSGAGKTTLIECISGRRRCGVTGDIMVTNCTKRTKLAYMAQDDAFMPCLTVYETLLFASKLRNYQRNNRCKVKLVDDNENVYNATTYPDKDLVIRSVSDDSTNARSGGDGHKSLPDETYHQNLVNQIIHKLGLDQCRNVKAENCSGGQQKRLCIALELIHSPTILILDEPTSGLDSVSCLQCVSLLRDLAHNPEQPMAIAASIHQPTARILQNFDRLYVIASNGQCMYDGPTDQLVPHLAKYKLTCPTYHNPADFVLEIASGDYGKEVIKQLVAAQCDQHRTGCLVKSSTNNSLIATTTATTVTTTPTNDDTKIIKDKIDGQDDDEEEEEEESREDQVKLWPETGAATVSIRKICQRSRKQVKRREFYKTIILWLRCMLLAFRDPTEYLLRIFACVSIILLNIVLYNDSNVGKADGCSQDSVMHMINTIRSDYDGNQSFSITNSLLEGPGALAILNFGFIFFAMMFIAFLSMMPVILTFPLEVGVFYKEYFNGWYSFSSYFLAKNMTNLIPSVMLPIVFGASTYLITHQIWEPWRFFYFILLLVMISLVADGVGITISAIFVHNVNAASIFAATSQIPLILFTGLLVQIDTLPRFIRPFTYLSYYRLFFEAAIIVFYGYGRCQKPEPFDLKRIRSILGDDVEEVMDCVWQNTNFFESNDGPSLSDRLERILASTENQNPSLIMQNFRLKDEDLNFLMILLGSYAIISRIIAYIVLYRKANSKK